MSSLVSNGRNRWASQQNISSSGNKHVSSDSVQLWEKSSVVRALESAAQKFINDTAWHFKDSKPFFDMLSGAIKMYTIDFGFNRIMMLRRFLDLEEDPSGGIETAQALKLWKELDPILVAFTRVMAHLTANCVTPVDLVVYRGMKDQRGKRQSQYEAVETLKNLADISKIEMELKSLLKEPEDLLTIISDGQIVGDQLLNDTAKNMSAARTLMKRIQRLNENMNLESRDLTQLVNGYGDLVTTETFMSTSLAIEHARKFSDADCCMFQITIPAGTPCLYVSPYSAFTGDRTELEVVLPPCSRLIVQGRKDGLTRIRYDGVSDAAKHRMTLDFPRLYLLKQLLDTMSKGNEARFTLMNGLGFFKMCKRQEGTHQYSPLKKGKMLTTFSNDVLQNSWDEKNDPRKFTLDIPYKW